MAIETSSRRSRRATLTAALGAGAATIASALGRPLPAHAADGDTVTVGGTFTATSNTSISNRANSQNVFEAFTSAGTGVLGSSSSSMDHPFGPRTRHLQGLSAFALAAIVPLAAAACGTAAPSASSSTAAPSASSSTAAPSASSTTAAPSVDAAGFDEIAGLYVGVDNFDVLAGPLIISTIRSYLYLYTEGTIVNGYPDYGLEMTPVDPADPFTGRYAASHDMLEIEWNDGTRSRAERLDPTVFQLFGRTYARLDRSTDLALDGTYARLNGDPGWPVIRFRPDGTFDDQGILTYTGLTAAPRWLNDPDTLARIRGSGTWRVSNNTLYLDYAGIGQITACVYVPFGRSLDGPISEFDLNGFRFARSGL